MAALACSGGDSPTVPGTPDLTTQLDSVGNHHVWAVFDLVFDVETETAEIVWKRTAEGHHDVTYLMQPPQCFDCVMVTGSWWFPVKREIHVQLKFKNNTGLTGCDVRGILSDPGGGKFILNPDGVTQVWGPAMQFLAHGEDDTRLFPAYSEHGRLYEFYFPPGEDWKTFSYIVDASFPNHVTEPLVEDGVADDLVNNGYSTADMRCFVWDHQGGIQSVTLDLLPIGGSPMTVMFDDGQNNDGGSGDGIYGVKNIKTTADLGIYMLNVIAMDSQFNMGMGQIRVNVVESTGGPNDDPIIQSVDADRTTAKGPQEKISITVAAVDPNGDPLEYEFQCPSGQFSGQSGGSVIWTPSTSKTGPQLVTITVHDNKGGQDSTQITLYSTDKSVIAGSTSGMIPSGVMDTVVPSGSINMTSDFQNKVLYCNFWATWCPPCVGELPHLCNMYKKYQSNDGYRQVMIDVGESASTVQNFLNQHPDYAASYWALDSDSSYFYKCNDFNGDSNGIPQHVLFDRDGRCRWSQIGGMSSTGVIEDVIDQLL